MPTALSSTDSRPRALLAEQVLRPLADVATLLRFRARAVRRRQARRTAAIVLTVLTVAVAVVPAYLPGAADSDRSFEALLLLPTGMAGFLLLAIVSAVASGGGRELLARDQAVAFPVSPTADHLGALLLAPLNIAWLLQGWFLVGATSYAVGPNATLPGTLAVVLLWVVTATAIAQIVAWTFEAIRRTRHGVWVVRAVIGAFAVTVVWVQVSGRLASTLDQIPLLALVVSPLAGNVMGTLGVLATLVVVFLAAVALGALPAHLAARRPPRDELRGESRVFAARPIPRSDLAMALRLDRASVWRAVPMRRGLAVLAIGPGAVALAGGLPWDSIVVLPGLVASGGALLFGVNAWCLDARGTLWRESLPVRPGTVFAARAIVLGEFLGVAAVTTTILAALRAGVPAPHEVAAIVCILVVVVLQVVATSMSWSSRRPYAVDLRSARATPAPPVVMVGYSAKLAITTTLTGLVFSGMAQVPAWQLSVVVALPFLLWSTVKLYRAASVWERPEDRAGVVVTVAA